MMRGPRLLPLCGLLLAAALTFRQFVLQSACLSQPFFSASLAAATGMSSSESASSGIPPPLLVLPLDELTRSSYSECANDKLAYVYNSVAVESPLATASTTRGTTIPPIVHQTSKSRCVTPEFADAAARWRTHPNLTQYYLHDDDAVQRLLHNERTRAEFPLLEDVAESCVASGTILSDLWRYVALYTYGGIYMDIDSVPGPHFDPSLLLKDGVDALFVVERDSLLSQYFMASSPGHPLMYYAIQETLAALWQAPDTGSVYAPVASGPIALHRAFRRFLEDGGGTQQVPEAQVGPHGVNVNRPVAAGTYVGTYNRTVVAVGTFRNADDYVHRQIFDRWTKIDQYRKMTMQHFSEVQKVSTRKSCARAILDKRHRDADAAKAAAAAEKATKKAAGAA